MTISAAPSMLERQQASDLVARLERIPVNRWHLRARMYVGVATFFDAFDLLAIASALPLLRTAWNLSPVQIGAIISSAFVGQIVGALLFGWAAERFGRLTALRWTVLIFSFASLACALSWDATSLVVCRFVQGIGLGGEIPVSGTYINEFAKANKRGRFFLLYETVFGVGITCTGLLSIWIVPTFGWKAMFVIGAVPALLGLVLRRVLPESPRWLISKGRIADADTVVRGMEDYAEARGIALPPPATNVTLRPREKLRLMELFEGIYLRRTLMIWVAWFCTFFVVYGTTTWLPTIYRTVFHLDLQTALMLGTANGVASLIGDLLVAFMIDILGRRLWYGLAFGLSALPLVALWWIGPTNAYTVFALAALSYIFIGSNAVSLLLYTAELYPTRMRATATSLASVWARVASSISPIVVGVLLTDFDLNAVFLGFAMAAGVGAVVCGFAAVETRRRVLEDVSP
jgi:putative MFS transporter